MRQLAMCKVLASLEDIGRLAVQYWETVPGLKVEVKLIEGEVKLVKGS